MNITDHLFRQSEIDPGKIAILHPGKISFAHYTMFIDNYAAFFQRSGLSKGSRIIVLLKPGIEFFSLTVALLRIGAVPVMIDPGMGIKRMSNALSRCNPEAFLGIPSSHILRILYPKAFATVRRFFSTGKINFPRTVRIPRSMSNVPGDNLRADMNASDIAAIFYTSGSTGPAKPVVYTCGMLETQLDYMKEHFKYHPDDIDLCTFPLIGLLVISHGITIVLADMDMTRPGKADPAKIIQNLNNYSCTSMFCSPMILRKIAEYGNLKNYYIPSLKKVLTAGAPVSPGLLRDFRKLLQEDASIHTPYGCTEALTLTDIRDHELLSLFPKNNYFPEGICLGYTLPGVELRIIRITDHPALKIDEINNLQPEEVGEIIARGPNVSPQYYLDDTANGLSKVNDGDDSLWHRTGDLGKTDKHGRIWYYGRKSQRVEGNGCIYFTIPCEAVYNQHPAVRRSALVGVEENGIRIPLICIELKNKRFKSKNLVNELICMGKRYKETENISKVLFHKRFPVDPRHNAKINREKLTVWAQSKI